MNKLFSTANAIVGRWVSAVENAKVQKSTIKVRKWPKLMSSVMHTTVEGSAEQFKNYCGGIPSIRHTILSCH